METKDKLMSETLCYSGKLLEAKGVRKDKETGKDIDWIKWKLMFDTGMQYPWQCRCFDNISAKGVQVKDMEEGKYYEVVYKINEYTHQEYGLVKAKQAVLIKLSDESKSTVGNLGNNSKSVGVGEATLTAVGKTEGLSNSNQPQQEPQAQADSSSLQKIVPDNFVAFAEEYKKEMGDKVEELHCVGAYILNKHADMFADVITLIKKEFEEKK